MVVQSLVERFLHRAGAQSGCPLMNIRSSLTQRNSLKEIGKMRLASGPKVPTPFGSIQFPNLETPPFEVPKRPDEKERRLIKQALGQDLTQVIALIPAVGDFLADAIGDMHQREIVSLMGMESYLKYAEYDKVFPSTVAAIRVSCFKKV